MAIPEPVQIHVNGVARLFENTAALNNYIEQEDFGWSWLSDIHLMDSLSMIPQQHNEVYAAASSFYSQFLREPIQRAKHLLYSAEMNKINIGSPTEPYIEALSQDGKLVLSTKHKLGDATAFFLLVYLTHNKHRLSYTSSQVQSVMNSSVMIYEKTLAATIAAQNLGLDDITTTAKRTELESMTERFKQDSYASLHRMDTMENQYARVIASNHDYVTKEIGKLSSNYRRRFRRYKSLARVAASAAVSAINIAQDNYTLASEKQKTATEELNNAEQQYRDKVDLSMSVSFWNGRLEYHRGQRKFWLTMGALSIVITFIAMMAYYGAGGITGMTGRFHPDVASQTQTTGLPPGVQSATPSTGENSTMLMGKSASDLSSAIADLVGAALLITLLATVIRLTLREFNNNTHFAQDAAERITFTQTYLALIGEGKLNADEDRRLVLESLFRPNQPSTSTEIGFSSPIEAILKTIADKSK